MNGVDFLQAESLLTGKEASPEVRCTFPSLQSYGPTEPFPIKHQEQQAELAVAGVGFSSANKAFRWEMSWPGPSAQKVKPAGSSYQVTITSMPGKRLWCLQLDSHWKHLSQHPSHTPTGAQAIAGNGARVKAEHCLALYAFLLSILRSYVSDLWNSKWQSYTMSNARERAGSFAIVLKKNRGGSEPVTSSLHTKHVAQLLVWVQEGTLPLIQHLNF